MPNSQLKFHRGITLERLDKFTSSSLFQDVNLFSRLYARRDGSSVSLQAYAVPDLKRITFDEAMRALPEYRAAKVGDVFGPAWATVWIRVEVTVPAGWVGEEVHFLWDAGNEGMVWTVDGHPLQAFTGGNGWDRRADYILTKSAKGGERFEFFIEMACNGMFGNGLNGQINPPDPDRAYKLVTAELAVVNRAAFKLWYDFQIVAGMAKELPADSQRGCEALVAANAMVNAFMTDDEQTWSAASAIAHDFLTKHKNNDVHIVTAVGHCHIDTAWLWPYDETRRKCARSWSSQIDLMKRYPHYKFACSTAQQFEWVKHDYPGLFAEIQEFVKKGQFVPVGGTWVEMDCNIPSGEAFVRQFLYGQRFFKEHFGQYSDLFWLPDTFGYAAQLPQIMQLSGVTKFLTQKLSWNNINKFPHTTFHWCGLDGSKVLTHFPPADTYNSQADVREVLFSVKNHKDKHYSNESLLLFGNGDGGGGPLSSMLERLDRMKDVNGLPQVQYGDPSTFFDRLAKNADDLVEWHGELYFELHRGTYTSQANNKMYNRKTELLLRDVEFLLTVVTSLYQQKYPKAELDRLWKNLLLNQFHDVLPGSSIEMVYDDSTTLYRDIVKSGSAMKLDAFETLLKNVFSLPATGDKNAAQASSASEMLDMCFCMYSPMVRSMIDKLARMPIAVAVLNTLGCGRMDLVEVDLPEGMSADAFKFQQTSKDNRRGLVVASAKPFSFNVVDIKTECPAASVKTIAGGFVLENQYVKVQLDQHGRLSSMFDKRHSREVIAPGELGNLFKIYEDIPLFWDGWDVEVYHLEKGWEAGVGTAAIHEDGPLRVSVTVNHPITKTSSLVQIVSLSAVSPRVDFHNVVQWNENRKFLKVEFPFDIRSDTATYETAFGWVQRPTHYNTSWDLAKFEVCGHRFADLSEFGYGAALLNDSKYGYATHGHVMRLSLLRAPKAPDAHCDIGRHEFKFAVYPHHGTFAESDVVEEALRFNVAPLTRIVPKTDALMSMKFQSYVEVRGARNVIVDTVKRAEDSNAVIVRMYEAYGGRAQCQLVSSLPVKSATIVNLLEDFTEKVSWADGQCSLTVKPFQIVTVKLEL